MSDRPQDVPSQVSFVDVVIASGASLSGAANLGGMHLVGIITSVAWTNAGIAFEGKGPGSETFYPIHNRDTGAEIAVTVGALSAARWYPLDPSTFAGVNDVKIRSGTKASPVNQGAERTLRLVCRTI